MAVTEGTINVGTSDVQLDTTIVTQSTDAGSALAHREGVFIGDPAKAKARAEVGGIPGEDAYAMGVSDHRLQILESYLESMLTELRIINLHLQQGSDEDIDEGDIR